MTGASEHNVVVTPNAFALMALHALRHRSAPIHGILVGVHRGEKVEILDAFPVCHETPTRVLVESSLGIVLANLEENASKSSIVGWYTAPEIGTESADPVALRIAASLERGPTVPVVLQLDNAGLERLLRDANDPSQLEIIRAFGKDFGKQWMQKLPLTVEKQEKTIKAIRELAKESNLLDLVDLWSQPSSNEWLSNGLPKIDIGKYL